MINSPPRKDLQRLRVNRQSTWEGSMKNLEGLPLTMLILGGSGQWTVHSGRIMQRLIEDLQRLIENLPKLLTPQGVDGN